jgi:hypothetical protein
MSTLDEFDGLSEEELEALSMLGRVSTVSFSLAATALFVGIGMWIEPDPGMGTADVASARQSMVDVVLPICAFAGLFFAVVGYWLVERRRRLLETIAERQRALDESLSRKEGSTGPALSDVARSPSRSLLRW